jgi:hypothetical protein
MKRLHLLGFALLAAVPVVAQTTPPPATCTTPPERFTAFNIERSLNIGSSNVFTTLTPNIPAEVLAAVTSGALQVREQASLDLDRNVVTVQAFTAQPESPSPTLPGNIHFASILWRYEVAVEDIHFSCQPVPSVLIVGRIQQNTPVTPFGKCERSPGSNRNGLHGHRYAYPEQRYGPGARHCGAVLTERGRHCHVPDFERYSSGNYPPESNNCVPPRPDADHVPATDAA